MRCATPDSRRAAADAIAQQIAQWTTTRSALDIEAQLQRSGVPAHAVQNAALVKSDAQLAQREHFVRCTHGQLGDVYVESVGYRFSDMRPSVGKVPSLGGDSEWVMREILRRG